MSIPEAIKGARIELQAVQSPAQRIRIIASYARIIASEVLGTIRLVPYGIKAKVLHTSLPTVTDPSTRPSGTVSIMHDVTYGPLQRNTMDIYLPCPSEKPGSDTSLALFCHGGVWATGEAWHYSPMATRLAQCGIITAVLHYTLYPNALLPVMVKEVDAALSFTLDCLAPQLGMDARRVNLVGHSAGAQLCAMALLHRSTEEGKKMPKRMIGISGVYDLAEHFEYERNRGVHTLSTMERAAGGAKLFASQSPTVILRKYTTGATAPGAVQGSRNVRKKKRHGDAIAERAGFTVLNSESSFHEKIQSIDVLSEVNPKRLPPFSLLCSTSDTVVPWRESSDMLMALREAGVDAELLMYDHVGHGDFVVDWKPDASSEMKEHSKDLVEILQYGSEEVD